MIPLVTRVANKDGWHSIHRDLDKSMADIEGEVWGIFVSSKYGPWSPSATVMLYVIS